MLRTVDMVLPAGWIGGETGEAMWSRRPRCGWNRAATTEGEHRRRRGSRSDQAGDQLADGGGELETVAGEAGGDSHRPPPVDDEMMVGGRGVQARGRARCTGIDTRQPASG